MPKLTLQLAPGYNAYSSGISSIVTGKVKPYDTLGLGDGICNAIEMAIECDKYDKMPKRERRSFRSEALPYL